jgi:outer membrane protein assembly factor BamB/SAM-dependent methyltransferase
VSAKSARGLLWIFAFQPFAAAETFNDPRALASEIVRASGVTGGLCVHLGCGDGKLTAELRQDGRFLVQGISPTAALVRSARKAVQARGNYGPVSVIRSKLKRLPYTSNLVNLVIADDLPRTLNAGLTFKEILRVLAPGGTAFVGQRAGAQPSLSKDRLSSLLTKAGITEFEWSNRGGLWMKFSKPVPLKPETWSRGSHFLNGNAVYQDASGPFTHLQWAAGPKIPGERYQAVKGYTSANGRNFCVFKEPPSWGVAGKVVLVARDAFNGLLLWQRPIDSGPLFAVGDRVYAILEGSLKSFDAATGKALLDFQTGRHVGKCFVREGILFIVSRGGVRAVNTATGEIKWKSKGASYHGRAAWGDGKLFYSGYGRPTPIVCLDSATGEKQWVRLGPGSAGGAFLYRQGVLVISNRGGIFAYSAKDGSPLWESLKKNKSVEANFRNSMFSVGGMLWTQEKSGGVWTALDINTGKEKKRLEYSLPTAAKRCSPAQATSRYFIDDSNALLEHATGKLDYIRAARSGCGFGFLPANGMVYSVPNKCVCFPMLRGFMGIAPEDWWQPEQPVAQTDRLERGPAFGKVKPPVRGASKGWRTLRHDAARSGATGEEAGTALRPLWEIKLGEDISGPVSAEGIVCVSLPQKHRVDARDADTGKKRWSFTAGGPVDGPPTIHEGIVIFGCRDGWAYCLRATDGALVWRFRATPEERRIVVFGQLESSWPVRGSVLVNDGKAYFAAGRSSELDGGIYFYGVSLASGESLLEERISFSEFHGGIKKKSRIALAKDLVMLNGSVSMHAWSYHTESGKQAINSVARSIQDSSVRAESGLYRLRLVPTGWKKPPKHQIEHRGKQRWVLDSTHPLTTFVLAGETLYAGGPASTGSTASPGGIITAVSSSAGTKLNQYELSAPPVPFGIAATAGRLYVATRDGKLTCLSSGAGP